MITKEQLLQSDFRLIVANYSTKTPEENAKLDAWLELVLRAIRDCRPEELNPIMDRVMRTMGRGQKPMPEDFQTAKKAWRYKGENETAAIQECAPCKSRGWMYVTLWSPSLQKHDQFVKPCPSCRPNHPLQRGLPPKGWVEPDGMTPDRETLDGEFRRLLKRVHPAWATKVLKMIEDKKVSYPEWVIQELIKIEAKGGGTPPETMNIMEGVLDRIKPEEKK